MSGFTVPDDPWTYELIAESDSTAYAFTWPQAILAARTLVSEDGESYVHVYDWAGRWMASGCMDVDGRWLLITTQRHRRH